MQMDARPPIKKRQSPGDDDLEMAIKDREFWDECLVAAIGGARRGLRTALDLALAAEKREAE